MTSATRSGAATAAPARKSNAKAIATTRVFERKPCLTVGPFLRISQRCDKIGPAAVRGKDRRLRLLRREPGELHHLLPHLGFFGGESLGLRRCAVQELAAGGEEALLQRFVGDHVLVSG